MRRARTHTCSRVSSPQVVVVTSGAIGTGAARMRRNMALSKPLRDSVSNGGVKKTLDQNASAALGQALLMNLYESLLSKYNLSCAQACLRACARLARALHTPPTISGGILETSRCVCATGPPCSARSA